MSIISQKAIHTVRTAKISFCKFIQANDTSATKAHQAGYHLSKKSWPLFFDREGVKGELLEKFVKIKWQDDFTTDGRFIYYGQETRNEYRVTRFGKNFPFRSPDNIGDLLILAKMDEENYEGYVLSTEEEIEDFFAAFNMSPEDTGQLIDTRQYPTSVDYLSSCITEYIASIGQGFPSTENISTQARVCFNKSVPDILSSINQDPDGILLNWIQTEYQLFKEIEKKHYAPLLQSKFDSMDHLIDVANTILNRRKSRAGSSLEHHLSQVFTTFRIPFERQGKTEGRKKPDFIFPNTQKYKNKNYSSDMLFMLAAKTTCKDRWRQILNEADRIPHKHLFTLQQGISSNQLHEMFAAGITLVVPAKNIELFPKEERNRLMSLKTFSSMVLEKLG